jgi:membrane fusion protein (multidrug efflux system)
MDPTTATPSIAVARRKKARRAFLILAIVASAVAGGYLLYGWWTRGKISDDNAQVDADVVPVSARVGGVIQKVYVTDHQKVEAGAKLVDLDTVDLDLRWRQADADLKAARAQAEAAEAQVEVVRASSSGGRSTAQAGLTESNAGVRTADAQIKAAAAAVARADSDLKKTAADLARAEQLKTAGAITDVQVDAARAANSSAQASADQARANLAATTQQRSLAQAKVGEARGRVEQSGPVDAQVKAAQAAADLATARVESATVALAQAEQARSYAHLVSPVAGTVSRLAVHEGQTVQMGAPIVVVVPDATYVVANVKETELGQIQPQQQVDIEVDAYPGRTFHGEVSSIAGATGARFSLLPPDNATGNFVKVVQRVPVKITWKDLPDDVVMRAGLSAEVVIHVSH